MSDTSRGKQIAITVGDQPWWEVEDPKLQLQGHPGSLGDERQVKTLHRLQTICAWCNKIRTGEGHWRRARNARQAEAEVKLSHGICPECAENSLKEYRLSTFAVSSEARFA